MSMPLALIVLMGVAIFFWLEARTLVRELKTGVPHLFFSPHPAYRGRLGNRRAAFFWFSAALRIFRTLMLALMVLVAVLFLLESLGVIYQ